MEIQWGKSDRLRLLHCKETDSREELKWSATDRLNFSWDYQIDGGNFIREHEIGGGNFIREYQIGGGNFTG